MNGKWIDQFPEKHEYDLELDEESFELQMADAEIAQDAAARAEAAATIATEKAASVTEKTDIVIEKTQTAIQKAAEAGSYADSAVVSVRVVEQIKNETVQASNFATMAKNDTQIIKEEVERAVINIDNKVSAAETSAQNAATSETSAQTYSIQASNSALAAAQNVQLANDVLTEVEENASKAAQSATEAATSATNAESSASAASNSASAASSSASDAENSATNAEESATTASQKAGEAATSASAASTSATNASNYASTASQKAVEASNSATAAANSASAATTDKTTVQSLKNTFETVTVPNAVEQINTEGTQQKAAVEAAGSNAVDAVESAETVAVQAVQTESTTQLAAIQAKGEETIASIPEDYTALSGEVDDLKSATTHKADVDGTYTDLTAGSAEQLLSSTGVEDAVPYSFRQTCGGNGVGARVDEEIVGGTICWNQLVQNGNFANGTTGWNCGNYIVFEASNDILRTSCNIAGAFNHSISKAINFYANHVYLISFDILSASQSDVRLRFPVLKETVGSLTANTWTNCAFAFKMTEAGSNMMLQVNGIADSVYQWKNIVCADLTQMFGVAVADQIYAMETASAGAGIAYFRSLFPAEFYAYNAGELMSVNAARKETVGFNLFDISKAESGKGIGPTGAVTGGSTVVSDFIPVIPGATYYGMGLVSAFGGRPLFTYDAGKNPIKEMYVTPYTPSATAGTFTLDQGVAYVRLSFRDVGIACFNISDTTKNGTYEPYAKHTYPLDSTLTLRGIPKLDSNNKLCYDGDIYKADGTVTRRYSVVDLGTLTWDRYQFDSNYAFYAQISTRKTRSGNSVCAKYANTGIGPESMANATINTVANGNYIYIRDDSYTSAAYFKAAMSGVYLVYELATPATETAEPYQQIQVVDPLGTEEYVDASVLAGTRDVTVPVGHNSLYMTDLRKKIENIPGDFSTLLAPIEAGFKATRAYAVNEFLIVNSQLYKVIASIANGATITPGTNVTATTVGAVLTALLNS